MDRACFDQEFYVVHIGCVYMTVPNRSMPEDETDDDVYVYSSSSRKFYMKSC